MRLLVIFAITESDYFRLAHKRLPITLVKTMNFPTEIPTPKKTPSDYARNFQFHGERGSLFVARGPEGGIGVGQKGEFSEREESLCLDWLGEVVAKIRAEVGW